MSIKSDKWIHQQCMCLAGKTLTVQDGKVLVKQDVMRSIDGGLVTPTAKQIIDYSIAVAEFKPMIEPYCPEAVREVDGKGVISYGVSSYGYDARLAKDGIKIFTNINNGAVDPRKPNDDCYVEAKTLIDEDGFEFVWLPANSFMLGHTLEYFRIPRDVLSICMGKSTYARVGVNVTVTPLEPEWEGNVVIEIANLTTLPMKIYPGMGVCQFLFLQSDEACVVSYADRGGKYQGQTGTTHAKV